MKKTWQRLVCVSLLSFTCACGDTEEMAQGTDLQLLNMAKSTVDMTWYKNSDASLARSSGSGHNEPFLATRYNAIAAAVLDANKKVDPSKLINGKFPEGSLIVKELRESDGTISKYAIMYKQAGHADEGGGWVWGYVRPNGNVAHAASEKGSICVGCHQNSSGSIDLTLMNAAFP